MGPEGRAFIVWGRTIEICEPVDSPGAKQHGNPENPGPGAMLRMKAVSIISGFTNGKRATLHIIIPGPQGRTEGRVNMDLEDGLWKIGKIGIKDKNGTFSFN